MQCSGLQVAAFLLLLAGTILIAISIGTSSWSKRQLTKSVSVEGVGSIGGGVTIERGLWNECQRYGAQTDIGEAFKIDHDHCVNRYEKVWEKRDQLTTGEDFKQLFKDLQAWEVAVLAMMCGSGLLGILSLLFSPCCCNRCGCCLASFVFFAASLCASAVCTYAYYVSTAGDSDRNFEIKMKEFGWSFWCAVAGGACQFFSGIMFAVSRCRQHSYSHTI